VKRSSVDQQQQQLRVCQASQRAKSESPPSALSTAVTTSTTCAAAAVHRTATAPAFNNDTTAVTSSTAAASQGSVPVAPWITQATTQPANGNSVLLALPAYYAEHGLCICRLSVHLSIPAWAYSSKPAAASLLLWAQPL